MNIAEYLYFLLPSTLKKTGKNRNHFWKLFVVLGRHIEEIKRIILDVREQSMILSCPAELLQIFGEERDMPRISGESVEAYRNRLTMKAVIAEKAGTREGIRLALVSLGYEQSRIEPVGMSEPDRWAEFSVYLRSNEINTVNDLAVINDQIMRVKQASAKPAYTSEAGQDIGIFSSSHESPVPLPICNDTICGVCPDYANGGKLVASDITVLSKVGGISFDYPQCGRIICSEEFYEEIV